MRGIQGKTAIVTGAGSGIGRAIALRLAAEGVTVGVFDVRAEAALTTSAEIKTAGGQAFAVTCDITDYALVTQSVADFETATGRGTAPCLSSKPIWRSGRKSPPSTGLAPAHDPCRGARHGCAQSRAHHQHRLGRRPGGFHRRSGLFGLPRRYLRSICWKRRGKSQAACMRPPSTPRPSFRIWRKSMSRFTQKKPPAASH